MDRPISTWWTIMGWLTSTFLFYGVTRLFGGVTSGDASDSINTAWAFAHGIPSCAYAPGNQFGLPYTAPLYPLLSGGLAALLRIGHSVTFPNRAQMGPHCSNAINAMYHWWLKSGSLIPTIRLGYVGWLFLMVGAVALLRATGRGRTRWESTALVLLALTPSVAMCLNEYFHPQDLVAMGLILVGISFACRDSWTGVGVLLGLALATQQFTLLALAPLVVVAPPRRLVRMLLSLVGTFGVIVITVVTLSSSESLKAIFAGSGTTWNSGTLLDALHLSGGLLFLISRFLPIVAAMTLAWWFGNRIGPAVLAPVPLIALVTSSMILRLIFEVNFWGYYLMATSVLLILLDVALSRIRWQLILWLVLQPFAFHPVIGGVRSFGPEHVSWLPLWLWQIIFASGALALVVIPLAGPHHRARSTITSNVQE